ncbi:hypothetical protein DM828_13045 [Pseudomonas umsongensis]|nr:hypothetical protein [Pseudomonas umsongensis]
MAACGEARDLAVAFQTDFASRLAPTVDSVLGPLWERACSRRGQWLHQGIKSQARTPESPPHPALLLPKLSRLPPGQPHPAETPAC